MIDRKTVITLIIALCCSFSCGPQKSTTNLKQHEAIEIALPAINKDYQWCSTDKREYTAYFENGIWTVTPKLPEETVGGGPSAEVSDQTGIVIRTLFTE